MGAWAVSVNRMCVCDMEKIMASGNPCLLAAGGLALVVLLSGCVSSSQERQTSRDPASAREATCNRVRLATLGGPTRSGSFGESVANAEAAYANCMAGLPINPTPAPTVTVSAPPVLTAIPPRSTTWRSDGYGGLIGDDGRTCRSDFHNGYICE